MNSHKLDPAFFRAPIAHRGLHRPESVYQENSLAACKLAAKLGYGIELDLQSSQDHMPMVFHDAQLDRLTAEQGRLQEIAAADLHEIRLNSGEKIPHLRDLLTEIAGRAPLLVEIKSPDEAHKGSHDAFAQNIIRAAEGYDGAIAFMSFNAHIIARLRAQSPKLALGLIGDNFLSADWSALGQARQERMQNWQEALGLEVDFISHNWIDLERVKDLPCPKFCWTIKSQSEADQALRIADNITFEGFTPKRL